MRATQDRDQVGGTMAGVVQWRTGYEMHIVCRVRSQYAGSSPVTCPESAPMPQPHARKTLAWRQAPLARIH